MSVKSDERCPKCGKYEWWHSTTDLNKSGKTVTIISRCDHCHTYFKQIKRLKRLTEDGKLAS